MNKLWLTVVLLFVSCDSCLPESWRVTPARKVAIPIITRHKACIQGMPCAYCNEENIRKCHADAERDCVDAGQYPSCAHEEPEGTCCGDWR